jgi:hypothetical protein
MVKINLTEMQAMELLALCTRYNVLETETDYITELSDLVAQKALDGLKHYRSKLSGIMAGISTPKKFIISNN